MVTLLELLFWLPAYGLAGFGGLVYGLAFLAEAIWLETHDVPRSLLAGLLFLMIAAASLHNLCWLVCP